MGTKGEGWGGSGGRGNKHYAMVYTGRPRTGWCKELQWLALGRGRDLAV